MKEAKAERPPPEENWIEKVRQVLSVPKAEIDRREAEWRKQKRKRARARARAVTVLACLVSSIFGCHASKAGSLVRFTSNPEVVHGCKYVGEVVSRSLFGGVASVLGEASAVSSLKDDAAEKGADTILSTTATTGWGGSTQRGEAYQCSSHR